MRRLALILLALVLVSACTGNDSPMAPSDPPPSNNPPTPTLYTIQGTVRQAGTGGPTLSGATVRVVDGPNAGRSATTDGSGGYSLTGLQSGGFTLDVSAAGYNTIGRGITLTASRTENFSLLPSTVWSQGGTGNTVFDMPRYVSRVRIQAVYAANSTNFIVRIGGSLVINELLGTFWNMTSYDGTHLTSGGVVEITNSSGVPWSFTEVR